MRSIGSGRPCWMNEVPASFLMPSVTLLISFLESIFTVHHCLWTEDSVREHMASFSRIQCWHLPCSASDVKLWSEIKGLVLRATLSWHSDGRDQSGELGARLAAGSQGGADSVGSGVSPNCLSVGRPRVSPVHNTALGPPASSACQLTRRKPRSNLSPHTNPTLGWICPGGWHATNSPSHFSIFFFLWHLWWGYLMRNIVLYLVVPKCSRKLPFPW